MVTIGAEQRPGFLIPLRHRMQLGSLMALAQRPGQVVRDRQAAAPAGVIAQPKELQFHRRAPGLIHRDEYGEGLLDGMTVVLEDCVAGAMPGAVGTPLASW